MLTNIWKGEPMSIHHHLTQEHRNCDEDFAKAEKSVASGSWDEALQHFISFKDETLKHFEKEEEILFPAFESHTGITEGPTKVMRYEHDQIRGLLDKLAEALETKSKENFFSLAESLMILLQQHNMKEEQMLYVMCDAQLPEPIKSETLKKMKAL